MGKIKTRADLFRAFAGMLDMVERTPVKPDDCVKYYGKAAVVISSFPGFIDNYQIAIAILENKPVFPGDIVYHKMGGKYVVEEVEMRNGGSVAFRTINGDVDGDFVGNYTWTKLDKYAHLRKALADGKKVAFLEGGEWIIPAQLDFTNSLCRFKIVEDDRVDFFNIDSTGLQRSLVVKVILSGVTGRITAEVVE